LIKRAPYPYVKIISKSMKGLKNPDSRVEPVKGSPSIGANNKNILNFYPFIEGFI